VVQNDDLCRQSLERIDQRHSRTHLIPCPYKKKKADPQVDLLIRMKRWSGRYINQGTGCLSIGIYHWRNWCRRQIKGFQPFRNLQVQRIKIALQTVQRRGGDDLLPCQTGTTVCLVRLYRNRTRTLLRNIRIALRRRGLLAQRARRRFRLICGTFRLIEAKIRRDQA
jgi:hypothetical protein